ncbi:MAG: sodium:alanine symporter family protein [Flavobacteriaceae bacterium TMED238]|nr:sodium:alanine symporter family protein [Paracoccaceae bacterium]RPG63634.1 MAG: sodium:alanine symporter family protein [Flavobacteriaceae bacterium TMED238]|tara:strand:- start:870 stop:2540 length:1671 start_codon:yes stop_codon:yes gene_type:complete
MNQFNEFLLFLDSNLSGSWWFPILLVGTGIFFTIYLGFPQFKFFGKAWKLVSGKNTKSDAEGETTAFEALTTAMSGAVGTGNIGGVALAIWTGGPAAIFWMWITAIFGMTTKFVEVTMGHKYRTKLEDGSISGGPMYYIEHALNMKWAGILFAFLMMITAIGSGNMPQINNIALVMNTEFSVPKLFTGLFLGALLWVIIIGGIKRIASVASKIIPIMGLIYFGGALVILAENYHNIIPSFNAIFSQVFTGSAAVGGFLGASFAMSLKYGVARGLYSNEAGQGSSPIAHASSKNKSIDQGVVSILEPFIDTIVVCSVTALVILSSGVWTQKFDTNFSKTDMVILEGVYSDEKNIDGSYIHPKHINELTNYVQSMESNVNTFTGTINVENGKIVESDITILHSRSIAEDISVKSNSTKDLYSGLLTINNGKINERVSLEGKSLVSSAELTAKAFSQGIFGDFGGKLVAIALLLFAFSTAITWCYYGDRSTAYIFGEKGVFWYRNFYVLCFILAAVIDTTIVWNIAYVVVALVSIPNLIALFVLRSEMKDLTNEFIKEN